MMRRRLKIWMCVPVGLVVCFACQRRYFDEGRIENGQYINDSIGWVMDIPQGWKLKPPMSSREKKVWNGMIEHIGYSMNILSQKSLIQFGKGKFNIFVSGTTLEIERNEKRLLEYVRNSQSNTYDIYTSFHYTCEVSLIRPASIDGVSFLVFSMEMTAPESTVPRHLIVYTGLIHGRILEVIIMYNNPSDKTEVMNAWLNSKFSMKE